MSLHFMSWLLHLGLCVADNGLASQVNFLYGEARPEVADHH